MPYFLKKYPKGWKVVDDKGHYYSKRPISKQRAVAQMRALYANTTHTGKGYTVYQMGDNTHYVLHGQGRFTEWIKKGVRKVGEVAKKLVAPGLKAVRDLTSPITRQNDYPPKVRALIAQYKNCMIKSAYARRFPIYDVLEKVLNFISANRFGEIKRSLGYDKLFHLSLVVGVQCPDGKKLGIMIEKNEVINITTDYKDDGEGTQLMPIPVPVAIPFGAFLEKARESVGPSFFQYDAFQNNCQIFVRNLLQANGLLNPQVEGFIMQDTLSLVQQLPDYVAPFARVVTNIAGIADRFIEGEGKPEQLEGAGKYKDKLTDLAQKAIAKVGDPSKSYNKDRINSINKYLDYFKQVADLITQNTQALPFLATVYRKPAKEALIRKADDIFNKIVSAMPTENRLLSNRPNGLLLETLVEAPGGQRFVIVKSQNEDDFEPSVEETAQEVYNTGRDELMRRWGGEPEEEPEPVAAAVAPTDGATFAGAEGRFQGENPMFQGRGFFDDVGSWFKTAFTGQRDTYPLQPLYDVVELIGPAPLASDYGFNELEMSRGQRQSAQLALQDPNSIFREIENKKADRYEAARRKLYAEGKSTVVVNNELRKLANKAPYYRDWLSKEEWCQYETQRNKTQNRPPPSECGTTALPEGQTYDAARQATNLCAWLKTPEGQQYKAAVSLWNANKKEVEKVNLEIVKNNEMIEAENQKIRDCNDSIGCSLKTALGSLTDVVSWIPGPVGTIAGLANTGLSFIGDGKPKKRGGRRLPPMPDLTIEQFDGMYGKPPTRDQYPAGPEGDAKYNEVMKRRQEAYEARKKGISPANPTTTDFISRGQKIVAEQEKQKANYIAEQQRKAKSFPDVILPQCDPAPDRTEEYRSAGVGALAFGLAQRGRGKKKRCCGKCEKKNDGSCRMKGGCGMCGGKKLKGGSIEHPENTFEGLQNLYRRVTGQDARSIADLNALVDADPQRAIVFLSELFPIEQIRDDLWNRYFSVQAVNRNTRALWQFYNTVLEIIEVEENGGYDEEGNPIAEGDLDAAIEASLAHPQPEPRPETPGEDPTEIPSRSSTPRSVASDPTGRGKKKLRGGIRISDIVSQHTGRPITNFRELNDAIVEYGEQQLIEDLILNFNLSSDDISILIQSALPFVGERGEHNNAFYEMLDLLDDLREQAQGPATRTGSPEAKSISSEPEPENEFFDGKGNKVVMNKKDYLAEHKRLIGALEDIRKKATAEEKKQKAEPELKKGAGRKKTAFKGIHWGTFSKQWKAYKKHKFATLEEFADYIEKNPKEFKPITFKRALFYKNLVLKGGNRDPADSEVEAINRNYNNFLLREAQKIAEVFKNAGAPTAVQALNNLKAKYDRSIWADIKKETDQLLDGALALVDLKRGRGGTGEEGYKRKLKHPEEEDSPPRAAIKREQRFTRNQPNIHIARFFDPPSATNQLIGSVDIIKPPVPPSTPVSGEMPIAGFQKQLENIRESRKQKPKPRPKSVDLLERKLLEKREALERMLKMLEGKGAPKAPAVRKIKAVVPKASAAKAKAGKSGAPVELPFSRDEYLKRVRAAATKAGYDGRAVEFSDKPDKKFMIYDDKGKKRYFGAKSYGDYIIWSAVDKEKAEQKKKVFHASHSKIRGNWAKDKYSPNSLALAVLW